MKCEQIDGVIFPTDEYIYLRDKFRIYNKSTAIKNIKIELYYSFNNKTASETVVLKPLAWYDFSEVLRDFFVSSYLTFYNVCFSSETPYSVRNKRIELFGYAWSSSYNEIGVRYYIDGAKKKTVVFENYIDCFPPTKEWLNRDIFRCLPLKDNYGEVVLYGTIEVPTQEIPCCDCNAWGYVLHEWDNCFIDEWGNVVEVNISGSLAQNDNCKIVTRKRMARINYLRGDGTGIVRWCEVANETIKTAQTKSSQRLVNEFINLWVNDTYNDIKRTVTLEWRDFPPDEIDRIAMGIALTPTCYIYMDNGTIYSGTLEQSATLKIAGNLQITLNVEIA